MKNLVFALPKSHYPIDRILHKENSIHQLIIKNCRIGEIEISNCTIRKKTSDSYLNLTHKTRGNGCFNTNSTFLKVPKKSFKKKRKSRKTTTSRFAKINKGLSDILKQYELSDSEQTQSNTSCTDQSSVNNSFTSISECSGSQHIPITENIQSEVEITDKMFSKNNPDHNLVMIATNKLKK